MMRCCHGNCILMKHFRNFSFAENFFFSNEICKFAWYECVDLYDLNTMRHCHSKQILRKTLKKILCGKLLCFSTKFVSNAKDERHGCADYCKDDMSWVR